MTRCPFSLSRLVKVSNTGQVVYQADKQACRAFPDPQGDGMPAGVKRNFQILPPLDFLSLRLPETGHAAHSAEGLALDSILGLLLEQVARDVKEGGSGSLGRVVERGCHFLCDSYAQ